ncbi:phosphoenolpyruvate--protein phosphotransferase [Bifidobacterium psychraerophilum]|jgi:phosphotransferase system enzyme I (PtsI)|uniref:phosphoenolpyruvate--protein phosphotransferase n=1 Tax=Bifidobacterium psychraerophilum TaxID=218140 RepID=UPI0023F4E4B5|nr:phosphoenolpyruvate--protein phosphotransferase [Bifidobacterium psychraerophilum]MCI1661156.1 phosphoenolpyruvate--protein phosphotransferase [Bifidobacterium psychraerophilum]MCI1803992.1 phosphoenolpyruvate--protein phosphotransferase [Bifidobacterium psychraerophilum]MCI2175710.1 phosphoenolpyruvate--protein phosphotransferase [Bifidobacterium psychraerophilum]MCI2181716.1 phosphoenolpyruvate--protein phosphotransferase [Bifidobacterium psychraerophilum]
MKSFQGVGVSAGIAIGPVQVLHTANEAVIRRVVEDPQAEVERFRAAQTTAIQQLGVIRDSTAAKLGEGKAELFDTHRLMLRDPEYVSSIEDLIMSSSVNAEFAVNSTMEQFAAMFAAMDNSYMQARASDIRDVSQRVIDILGNRDGNDSTVQGSGHIVAAEDLAPSETVQLDRSAVLGFVTEQGSSNSHTAILARTMGLPAVIGVHKGFESSDTGEMMVVDGSTGTVIIDPDDATLQQYREKQSGFEEHVRLLQKLKGQATRTSTGQTVRLYANIGRPSDVTTVLANDGEGIGLFRSEFLYLESVDFPTEEYQFEAYREVAQKMGDRLVVIRTLDIGADKQADYFGLEHEDNPALGYRAIRICLTQPEIFKVQLRALLRASAYGNIAVMFPMITAVSEVREAKDILSQVKSELRAAHVRFNEDIAVGIMIETPASVIMADELAAEVDFFSIGTNDLTQYTLACDRQNPNLGRFADPHSPAVLRMIDMTVKAAHDHGIWCGICGELGADVALTDTFLDMGIDELSVSPKSILPLREAIRKR